jgi:copper chaperone CopZ
VADGVKKTVLAIAGMRSNACRERVVEVLEQVEGVRDVDVSLIRARATVLHDLACDPAELMRAVAEAGYVASAP